MPPTLTPTEHARIAEAGAGIRRARLAAGLSIRACAAIAGVHPMTLHRLERGLGNPTLAAADRIARALGGDVVVSWPGDGCGT